MFFIWYKPTDEITTAYIKHGAKIHRMKYYFQQILKGVSAFNN